MRDFFSALRFRDGLFFVNKLLPLVAYKRNADIIAQNEKGKNFIGIPVAFDCGVNCVQETISATQACYIHMAAGKPAALSNRYKCNVKV
jgi:hypothetical protein